MNPCGRRTYLGGLGGPVGRDGPRGALRRAGSTVTGLCLAWVISCGTANVSVLTASPNDAGAIQDARVGDVDIPRDGAPPADVGTDGDSRAAYCAGSGPPLVSDQTDAGVVETCTGQIAQRSFRYALCTCDGIVSDHALTTDAFDSRDGAYDPMHTLPGGSVGTNGNLNAGAALNVGGSLWATDASGLTTSAVLTVSGELHAAGEVHAGPMLTVGADAWLAGGLQTAGNVEIGGTLYLPAGAQLSIGGQSSIGSVSSKSVPVAPACDCAPTDRLDVAGFVATYRAVNDDAMAGLDPKMLANVTQPLSATIPCGRLFLDSISASAAIHLTVAGRAAIFVGGDLSTTSDFQIDVPAGSELDLFVERGVTVGGTFLVGNVENPARARVYVGGTGTVDLQGASQMAGNLYCPLAQLVLGGSAPAALYGSIFASRLSSGADLTIHYDEAVLSSMTGSGCQPPTNCGSCLDCGGQSCRGGTCGACTDSTDCCAPLVCRSGTCLADVQ